MDRFIVAMLCVKCICNLDLKSNMDRFIDQTKIKVIQAVFI